MRRSKSSSDAISVNTPRSRRGSLIARNAAAAGASSASSSASQQQQKQGLFARTFGWIFWIITRLFLLHIIARFIRKIWRSYQQLCDRFILVCAEYCKSLAREVLLLGGQVLNNFAIFVLFLVYQPGHYRSTALYNPRAALSPSSDIGGSTASGAAAPSLRRRGGSQIAAGPHHQPTISQDSDSSDQSAGDLGAGQSLTATAAHPVGWHRVRSDDGLSFASSTSSNHENKFSKELKRALGAAASPHSPRLSGFASNDDLTLGSMASQGSEQDLLEDENDDDKWMVEEEVEEHPFVDDLLLDESDTDLWLAAAASSLSASAPAQRRPGLVLDEEADTGLVGLFTSLWSFFTGSVSRFISLIRFCVAVMFKLLQFVISLPSLLRYRPTSSTLDSPQKRSEKHSSMREILRKKAATVGFSDKIRRKEKLTTGLFEDILLASFQFIDDLAVSLMFLIRLYIPSAWRQFIHALRLFHPSHLVSKQGIDERSVGQLIQDEGYNYEKHQVTTEDGYILKLDRIPRSQSRKIIFFQHGILDSSFAWVGQGADSSLAFKNWDMGYDVWMGNFRGNGPQLHHTNPSIGKDYWNFSFNEHAFYDERAFIDHIVDTKRKELGCPFLGDDYTEEQRLRWDKENFEITTIAHSMGGASMLAYLVNERMNRRHHHISNAVLLAPAGNHQKLPLILRVFARIFLPLLPRVIPIRYLGFVSETSKILCSKLLQDINGHPAARSLFAAITSLSLLGGSVKHNPFQRIHNIFFHSFNGTSINVLKHLIQMSRSQQFQAFDYGPQVNMQRYDSLYPPSFLDNYHLIDIPVTFIFGSDDRVIPPEDVLKHFVALQKFHPNAVHIKRFENVGHLDIIHALDTRVMQYIVKILEYYDEQSRRAAAAGGAHESQSGLPLSARGKRQR